MIPGATRYPEKGMAGHASIPAWRVPCTEEPGALMAHRVAKESDTTEAHIAQRSKIITDYDKSL